MRARSARLLLAQLGLGSTLSLGVAKTASGPLEAHAWLQRNGEVVIGGDVQGFALHRPISEWRTCSRRFGTAVPLCPPGQSSRSTICLINDSDAGRLG
jgi:hypothetical protein